MFDTLIPIGVRVRIDERSEHFPGAVVWIIDRAYDEYAYCVSRTKSGLIASECQWIKQEHVHPFHDFDEGIPLGTKVRMAATAEHFPGEVVWVIGLEDDEYAYCVSRTMSDRDVRQCEWVKRSDIEPTYSP